MAIQAQMYQDNFALPLGLGGSQDWLMMDPLTSNVANNNEFHFNLQQQQQLQYQHQLQFMINLQQKNHSPSPDYGYMFLPSSSKNYNNPSNPTSNSQIPMNLYLSLTSQIEKQRLELDRFISVQNERLKLILQEQRKQQMTAMVNKVEEKVVMFLRQKEVEIEKARKTTMELEELKRKMEVESESWQRIAAENEAIVFSLSNKLEELKEQACCLSSSNGMEDAESCCNGNEYPRNRGSEAEEEETEESNREAGRRKKKMTMVCRVCNSRNACILFLPCRHLCSCKACEAFLDSCPVCKSAKRASIEALIP